MGITPLLFHLCLCPAVFRKEVDMQMWYSVSHLYVLFSRGDWRDGAEKTALLGNSPETMGGGDYISTWLEFLV